MPISKYPELKGALFPSLDAMQLAERKVDQQRAEIAAREAAEQAEREREEAERQAKAARIEAKRIAAEKRLQELAAARAKETEAEAQRTAEALVQKKADEERARQEAAEAARQAAALEQQRKLEAAQQEAQKRAARDAEVERQKREIKEKMARRQQFAEIEAEKTWLVMRVREGRLRVLRVGDEFRVCTSEGTPVANQEQFNWLYHAENLDGLNVEEQQVAKPKEPPAPLGGKKASMSVIAAKPKVVESSHTDRGVDIDRVVERFRVKGSLEEYLVTLPTAYSRLSSPGGVHEALLELYYFCQLCLAKGGADLFQQMCDEPKAVKALTESPEILAAILKHSPGNMYAMSVLGVQLFAGDDVLSSKVQALEVIPANFDEWMGWLAATRLFFDFLLWEEDGGADTQDPFARRDGAPCSNVVVENSCRAKLEQLVDAYNHPFILKSHVEDMMSRLGETVEELTSLRSTIVEAKDTAKRDIDRKLAKLAEEAGATTLQESKEEAVKRLRASESALEEARLKLTNLNATIANAEETIASNSSKQQGIMTELEAIRIRESDLNAQRDALQG